MQAWPKLLNTYLLTKSLPITRKAVKNWAPRMVGNSEVQLIKVFCNANCGATRTTAPLNQIKSEKLTIAPHHQSSGALVAADIK